MAILSFQRAPRAAQSRSLPAAALVVWAVICLGPADCASGAKPSAASSDEEMADEDSQPSVKPKAKSKSTKSSAATKSAKDKKDKAGASKPAARRLEYAFKEGEKYVYEVEIVLDLGDTVRTISGLSTYKVKRADDEEMVLEHDGRLVTRSHTRGGQPRFDHRHHAGISSFPGSFGGAGELAISSSGEVIKNTSLAQLPCLLGPL